MNELRYTLFTNGSSDKVLLPILTWLLKEAGIIIPIVPQWADLRGIPKNQSPKSLSDKILLSIEKSPCDLLFVHRDAEKEDHQKRVAEIKNAVEQARAKLNLPVVFVVPVRMQEAWLLFSEQSLWRAAQNKNGTQKLELPSPKDVESLANPKAKLHDLLKTASGLKGRRLKQFNVAQSAHRVVEYIDDFSPLRQLSAFKALEKDLRQVIIDQGWSKAF